jgi:hypothetical protein
MTDLFKHIHHAWRTCDDEDEQLSFYAYIVKHSSLGDVAIMFNAKRDEMNSSPCCGRHSGLLPVSVSSMENTPFVGGIRCDRQIRQDMRMLRRAYIALSGGEHPALQPEQDEASIRVI